MTFKSFITEQLQYNIVTDTSKKGIIRYLIKNQYDKEVGKLTIQGNLEKTYNWITAFYIDPAYRNIGLARRLLEMAINNSDRSILVRAEPYKDQPKDFASLIQMYKAFGFQPVSDNNSSAGYLVYPK